MFWLYKLVLAHGGFDARHTKWVAEQRITRDSSPYHLHDLLGHALDLAATVDQLDAPNCSSLEVVGRIYQLIEETAGSMQIEGIEHYKGKDISGSLKPGVALSPELARHTTEKLSQQTEIFKQCRKAEYMLEKARKARDAVKSGRASPYQGAGTA